MTIRRRESGLRRIAATTLAILIALPLAVVSDRFLLPGKALLFSMFLVMVAVIVWPELATALPKALGY